MKKNSASTQGAPRSKASIVREHMAAGEWREAIRIAARFPALGPHRGAILDAHMAFTNEGFVRQIKKDPAALIAAGIDAMKDRFTIPA